MTVAEVYLAERKRNVSAIRDRFSPHIENLYKMKSLDIEKLIGSCGHWDHRAKFEDSIHVYSYREEFLHEYGFSVPCVEMMDWLKVPGLPVLDPMCGTGYLGRQMEKAGLKVVASDDGSWHYFDPPKDTIRQKVWIRPPVIADAVVQTRKYRGHVVMLSWPYMDDVAYRVARAMHQGQWLAYIGESDGGCTADSDFFSYIRKSFYEVANVRNPQFWGLHDEFYLYRKRGR